MKKSSKSKNLSGRIAVKLFFLPLVFIFLVLICAGAAFYFMPEFSHMRSPEASYITAVSSEKKSSVDAWFRERTSDLEIISNHDLIKLNAPLLGSKQTVKNSTIPGRKTLSKSARSEIQTAISTMLKERAALGYRTISLIHADGTVSASTDPGIIGTQWGSIRFLTQDIKDLTAPLVRLTGSSVDRSVEMLIPVSDADGNVNALLFAQIDTTRLLSLIKVERPQFRSLNVSLTDQSNKVVFELPDFTPFAADKGALESGRFYTSVNKLHYAPLNIFVKVSRSETSSAMRLIIICYFAILILTGFAALFMVIRFNSLAAKPLRELAQALEAYRSGGSFIAGDINCKGELDKLRNELYKLIEYSAEQQTKLDNALEAEESSSACLRLLEYIPTAVKNSADQLKISSDILAQNYQNQASVRSVGLLLSDMAVQLSSFSGSINDIEELVKRPFLLNSKLLDLPQFFAELSKEAESIVRRKQLTFVSELISDETGSAAYADEGLIKRVVISLIKNAVMNTDSGTISFLVSGFSTDTGSSVLEIVVADTGRGLDDDAAAVIEQGGFSDIKDIELASARAGALLMSGSLAIENIKEKGLVATVVIPLGRS